MVDIVDGDTIDLADGTRVRLAIVDTPEVHGGTETCGAEASNFTGRFVAGQTVAIYRPDSAPRTDPYGRTLGEVVRVSDGASLNVALATAGFASVDERFTHEDPDLAARARAAHDAANTPNCATTQEPEPDPTSEPATTSDHTGNTGGGWSCHPAYRECLPQVSDLNCGDVGHFVHLFSAGNDPYGLDGNDDDGLGCESYPDWSSSSNYPYY